MKFIFFNYFIIFIFFYFKHYLIKKPIMLVFDREAASLPDCAQKAMGFLRESDKNREPADMLQALYQVFQKYK